MPPKKAPKKAATKKKAQDPFALIIDEHRQAAKLFKTIEGLSGKAEEEKCEKLYVQLSAMLARHMEMEEKIMYPVLEDIPPTHDITLESIEEHHVGKVLLQELSQEDLDDEVWHAKFKVLRENIDHHVEEEEEKMFPKARKALSAEQKSDLAEKLKAFAAQGSGPTSENGV